MLVLCVGMYRACSTWQYEVASKLLERFPGNRPLGFIDGGPFTSRIEPTLDFSNWSVLKVHDAHERYAGFLADGRGRGIYSHRDLRDVAFSWMHKTGSDFDEIVAKGFFDRCLRNDRFWRSQPGMLLQTYEGLVADPVRGVVEIAEHLNIDLGAGEAEAIASSFSLEANRKRTADIADRMLAKGIPLSSRDQDNFDPTSLLHWNHLRSGKVGDWRDQATAEQRASLARICGPWLIEHGYEVDDQWAEVPGSSPPKPLATPPKISYAANGEDILLDRLFQGQQGTFVDIGAQHPTLNNNSYYYYLRGWRGVNIDPFSETRDLFESCRAGDYNFAFAASDTEGDRPFYEFPGQEAYSTLSREAADEQLAQGRRVIERRVPTRTVAGLVEQYRLAAPDFCSIDVGGDVEPVLRGMPLATWQPKAFVIEATRPATNTPNHQSWEPILLEHGYLFAAFDGINRYYLRADMADSLPLLSYPLNSLDVYARAEVLDERRKVESLHQLVAEERYRAEEARVRLVEEQQFRAHSLSQFAAERDTWQGERSAFQQERDATQQERDAWQQERDAWQQERDQVQQERDAVQQERNAFQQERDAVQRERDSWQQERDAVQRERDSIQRERDAVQRERDDYARRGDLYVQEITRLREALAQERTLAQNLQAERDARGREVEEARSLLRPYRLIDRFGVVSAIQRRVRAHRQHPRS